VLGGDKQFVGKKVPLLSQPGLTILLAEQNATVAFNGLTSHNIRANLRMTWHFGEASIS